MNNYFGHSMPDSLPDDVMNRSKMLDLGNEWEGKVSKAFEYK